MFSAVPPSNVSIVGHRNGATVEVKRSDTSLQLTCQSNDAKPAPSLTWHRNDEPITSGVASSPPTSSVSEKMAATTSVLTFTPSMDDDGAVFSCRATNDALTNPISTSVTLNVHCTSAF